MEIAHFSIEKPIVEFTDGAIQKVRESLKGGEFEGVRLTVHLKRGEFVYKFDYVEKGKIDPKDLQLQCGNYPFFIPNDSLRYIQGSLIDFVQTGLTSAWVIDNPNPPWDSDLAREISQVFDKLINPGVSEHGGHIKLVGLKENIVYVEMSGGCQGCSMAGKTLRHGVMKILAEKFPEITDLIDITDHSAGSKPYFDSENGNIPTFKS
ncbi:MAG: NifU family protein [Nitrospiria bacterium]